jgi:acyl carrier protein
MSIGQTESSASRATAGVTESEILDWCIRYLAKSLKRSEDAIDPDAKFSRLGIDSATSVFLLVEIEEWLAIELPTDTIVRYPTTAKLARHIAASRVDAAGR